LPNNSLEKPEINNKREPVPKSIILEQALAVFLLYGLQNCGFQWSKPGDVIIQKIKRLKAHVS
jgi:hypothetical protein